MARAFRPCIDAMYEAGLELCAKSDVVVGTSSSFALKAAAMRTGVPYVVVDYMPVVRSRVVPPTGLADWGPFNGLRWVVLDKMLDMAFLRDPSALFAKVGLPKPKHAADVVGSGVLDLHAASPTLCPPAPDWPASFRRSARRKKGATAISSSSLGSRTGTSFRAAPRCSITAAPGRRTPRFAPGFRRSCSRSSWNSGSGDRASPSSARARRRDRSGRRSPTASPRTSTARSR